MTIADWLTLGFVCYRAWAHRWKIRTILGVRQKEKEMGAYVVRMRQQKKIEPTATAEAQAHRIKIAN